MTYRTTTADFNYFKSRCEYWQKRLNLMSWRLDFVHEKIKSDWAAATTIKYTDRVADISLNTEFIDAHCSRKELDETALHECLEVLLSPLHTLAHSRIWDDEEYEKENHTVIRVLEKILK